MIKCKVIDCKRKAKDFDGYCEKCSYWNDRMAGRAKIGEIDEDEYEDE